MWLRRLLGLPIALRPAVFPLLMVSILLSGATCSKANMITFDDLPAIFCGGTPLPNDYAGLTWNGFGYDNATVGNCALSGYATALASPPNIGFNLGGGVQGTVDSIDSSNAFVLLGGDFAAAFNDGLTVTIVGKLFGTTVGSVDLVLNTTTRTTQTFDLGPVTELDFSASGGTPHPGVPGSGWYFGMDNLEVNPVPEPRSVGLVGFGILVLAGGMRSAALRR